MIAGPLYWVRSFFVRKKEVNNIVSRAAAVILALFYLGGIVFHGYFFESEALAVASILTVLAGVAVLWSERGHKLTMLQLAVIAYALSYAALIPAALDREKAIVAAVQMLTLIPITIFSGRLSAKANAAVVKVIAWSGPLLAAIGIALDLYRNGRLESTLQYANALAIFLLAAGVCSILLAGAGKNPVYWLALAASLTGLCLTYSRSVWMLWGLALVLLVLGRIVRTRAMLYGIAAAHIGGIGAAMLLTRNALFFLDRVKSISPQASELQARIMYWQDAVRMWLDHPWGLGGGGWGLLLPEYRSQPYYVAYVHNHYLQTALDAGAVGIALLALLILLFYWRVLQRRGAVRDPVQRGLPALVTILLIHAGFDFDESFPLLLGLLIYLMSSYGVKEESEARTIWKRGGSQRYAVLAVPMVGIGLFAGYMALAYVQKESAQALMNEAPQQAADKLLTAERMVPWASSIPYIAAKCYIVSGNESGDIGDYRSAAAQLEAAVAKSPRQQMYQDLLRQLQTGLHK
jgi:O-antigen ligase